MKLTTGTPRGREIRRPLRLSLLLGLVACAMGTTAYGPAKTPGASARPAALGVPTPPRAIASAREASPSAAEFAHELVGSANQYATLHGDPARVARADCVQASPGHYMCSYAVSRPGVPAECHLMQARWTPRQASTFTVTLAGTAPRCGSLGEALRSLR
jgi:hypothetical protein